MSVCSMGKIIAVVFTHIYICKRQVVEGDWGVRCTFAETFRKSLKKGKVSVMVETYVVNAKGLQNPEGIGQGYVRVRVRVQNSEPSTNPYP